MWRPGAIGRRLQERVWNRRAESWDHGGAVGLQPVIEAVFETARSEPGDVVVDLGCGTGQLSLPLAHEGAEVLAVDLSRSMIDRLNEKATQMQLGNLTGFVCPIEHLDLPAGSVDLVVSSYVMHHLRNRDKERLVAGAAGWLRSGGRLVVGDMMFGRGWTRRDRAIITSKIKTLARRGPAGWWRVVKNLGRFAFRLRERPVGIETWKVYLERAGFTDIEATPVILEAAVVVGRKP